MGSISKYPGSDEKIDVLLRVGESAALRGVHYNRPRRPSYLPVDADGDNGALLQSEVRMILPSSEEPVGSDQDGVLTQSVIQVPFEALDLSDSAKSKVEVRFPNGTTGLVPSGVPYLYLLKTYADRFLKQQYPMVGVISNNEIMSMYTEITYDCSVEGVYLNEGLGAKIYRISLSFLLAAAVRFLFPERHAVVANAVMGHSFYFELDDHEKVSDKNVEGIKKVMQDFVARDLPLKSFRIPNRQAVRLFKGDHSSYILLKHRNDPTIHCHCLELGSFFYYALVHHSLVPTTGILKTFDLVPYHHGFLLRYPPSSRPDDLTDRIVTNPLIFSVFETHRSHGKTLGVHDVGSLNEINVTSQMKEYIRVAESLLEKRVANIADRIYERKNSLRLILIAGPSSSGKTTFCRKLQIQLKVLGCNPVSVSLDNYYRPRVEIPVDECGDKDYENLHALDVPLLNQYLLKLMAGEPVKFPVYDFVTGERTFSSKLFTLPTGALIMMEGIHGLNDSLTEAVPKSEKFKIYCSCLSQINVDSICRVSTTDNRLIRRIVRDHFYRGHSALKTMQMWPKVRLGENRNIFPFQNDADEAFNSCLDYELCVLKVFVYPLLRGIKPNIKEFHIARRLQLFLDNFMEVNPALVPPESILREFIGPVFMSIDE